MTSKAQWVVPLATIVAVCIALVYGLQALRMPIVTLQQGLAQAAVPVATASPVDPSVQRAVATYQQLQRRCFLPERTAAGGGDAGDIDAGLPQSASQRETCEQFVQVAHRQNFVIAPLPASAATDLAATEQVRLDCARLFVEHAQRHDPASASPSDPVQLEALEQRLRQSECLLLPPPSVIAAQRPGRALDQTASSSTSNSKVAFGGITPPAPRAP